MYGSEKVKSAFCVFFIIDSISNQIIGVAIKIKLPYLFE